MTDHVVLKFPYPDSKSHCHSCCESVMIALWIIRIQTYIQENLDHPDEQISYTYNGTNRIW